MVSQQASAPSLFSMAPRARAVRCLKQWIADGTIPVSERLPAEQALADRLRISRPTLRAALAELESEGLLCSRNRRGWVVTDPNAKSLLAQSVAILTDTPQAELYSWQKHGGWEDYIQQGAQEAIRTAGLHALALHPGRLDRKQVDRFVAERPVGMLGLRRTPASAEGLSVLTAVKAGGIPVAVYGNGPELSGYDTVWSDHTAGAYALTRFLIQRGCRRILRFWEFATTDQGATSWLLQRDAGYERAMAEAGIAPLDAVRYCVPPELVEAHTPEQFQVKVRLAMGYLSEHLRSETPVDGIMTLTDGKVYSVAAACRMLGHEPNRNVLIVGYDNYWPDCPERNWESVGPIATVDKLNEQVGHELVSLLLDRHNGRLPAVAQHRQVQPQLVVVDQER